MCVEHQTAYEKGDKLKAFYGKTVQKKDVIVSDGCLKCENNVIKKNNDDCSN
jgi:hypothetical protein